MADPAHFDSTQWVRGEYDIQAATITGDVLNLTVSCSGTSSKDFELVAWNYWMESSPVKADALLSFKPDTATPGSATRTPSFDLTPLKKAYSDSYRRQSGVVILRLKYLEPPRVSLRYEF
jgi:hypothetical protein